MSAADNALLAALVAADLANGGHRTKLTPALNSVAAVGTDAAASATAAAASAAASAATYALQLLVSGGSLGVGSEGLDLSLNAQLGGVAFAEFRQFVIRRPITQNATYQIVPTDFWTSMLLTTTGTITYTLPAWTDMPDYVPALIGKNRSGFNLTLARTGADTFDAAATSVVVPTGSHWEVYKSDTSGLWETRVFA